LKLEGFVDRHLRKLIEATINIVAPDELNVGDSIIWNTMRCEIVWKAKNKSQSYPFIKVIGKCHRNKEKISLHMEDYFYRIKSCKEEIFQTDGSGNVISVGIEEWAVGGD